MTERSSNETRTRLEAASTEVGYFDHKQPIANLCGNLPHWRQEGVTYFVTFRLDDSIPKTKIEFWRRERDDWLRQHPEPHTPEVRNEYQQRFIEKIQKWLDAGYGSCVLAQPPVRKIVADAFQFFESSRYLLREWVIMPNHVHVIVSPLADYKLSDILHSWKSYTSNQIHKLLGTKGTFWQKEPFDHIIRSAEQLEAIERYIHENARNLPADAYTLHCLHRD